MVLNEGADIGRVIHDELPDRDTGQVPAAADPVHGLAGDPEALPDVVGAHQVWDVPAGHDSSRCFSQYSVP